MTMLQDFSLKLWTFGHRRGGGQTPLISSLRQCIAITTHTIRTIIDFFRSPQVTPRTARQVEVQMAGEVTSEKPPLYA